MSQEMNGFGQCGSDMAGNGGNQPPVSFMRYWEVGEHRELMEELESFMTTVLWTNQIPFEIRYQSGNLKAVRNPVGEVGYKSLVGFMHQCAQWMELYWPGYAYRADLTLFFECFRQHQYARLFSHGVMMGHVDSVTAGRLYNDFVSYLRAEAISQGVKKKLADARATVCAQAGSLRGYIEELASKNKVLVPIRFDLTYQENAFDGNEAMPRMGWRATNEGGWLSVPSSVPVRDERLETRARIDPAPAFADRDSFFDNRRGADKLLFDHMVGHICKFEQCGRNRANHFHCILLMNPERLSTSDIMGLRFEFSGRWSRVTRGKGLWFDCHDDAYRQGLEPNVEWAIDRLDCSNGRHVKRFADYVVRYFAKDNKPIPWVKPTAKARTLTKGR
ncbi:hypothetical protein [Burkholderia seminalis]|uniref:hypothetical protein n=1 Tax=Burkholderia seminalis TaxID=488731 RepID=UPI00158C6FD6|nr:hypothetical protein [Burkholderia seminalis]